MCRELLGSAVSERAARSDLVVVDHPIASRAWARVRKLCRFKNSSRALPFERFDMRILNRFAGIDEVQVDLLLGAPAKHRVTRQFRAVVEAQCLWPRSKAMASRTRITRRLLKPRSISIAARHSRVKSSMTIKVRSRWPLASVSCMKSSDQRSLGAATGATALHERIEPCASCAAGLAARVRDIRAGSDVRRLGRLHGAAKSRAGASPNVVARLRALAAAPSRARRPWTYDGSRDCCACTQPTRRLWRRILLPPGELSPRLPAARAPTVLFDKLLHRVDLEGQLGDDAILAPALVFKLLGPDEVARFEAGISRSRHRRIVLA